MVRLLWITGLAVVALCGCGQMLAESIPAAAEPTPSSPARTNQQTFQARGVVVEVEADGKTVRIRHDTIPGYMQSMTMPFEVKDTNELAGLEPGDAVAFRLIVTRTDGWIDQVKKLAGPVADAPPTTGSFRLVRDVEPLKTGDSLPEYHFINEQGRPFSTGQFKGQALAINFLFTRCPFPTFCPLMANNFAETQKKLLARKDAPTNWHLLTISFDPEYDKPEVLKAYARSHGYAPERWTFATGELIDITAITEQLGQQFWHEPEGGISHNLRTAVIDASGRVQTNFVGNKWTTDRLVEEIIKAALVK